MIIRERNSIQELSNSECDQVSGGVNVLPFKPSPEPLIPPKFPLASGPSAPFPPHVGPFPVN